MAFDLNDLFGRLPAVLQLKDHAQGAALQAALDAPEMADAGDYGPLKSLLSVMLREGQIVAEDIAQLYDDQFIETCAPWVVPYLGALVGARQYEVLPGTQSARQQVATTFELRQRKGTLWALEVAVSVATGWPVHGVEYWERVAGTQSLRRPRLDKSGTADMMAGPALSRIGGAFDTAPRLAEMGRIDREGGRWNLPNIGLHIFRQTPASFGRPQMDGDDPSPGQSAVAADEDQGWYFFSPLGCDQALFHAPIAPDLADGRRRGETDFPQPLSRGMLCEDPAQFYGTRGDLSLWGDFGQGPEMIPVDDIQAAIIDGDFDGEVTQWRYIGPSDKVLIDPERGRFVMPSQGAFSEWSDLWVTYHHGRSHLIGGSERAGSDVPLAESHAPLHFTHSDLVDMPEEIAFEMPDNTSSATFEIRAEEYAAPVLIAAQSGCEIIIPDGQRLILSGLRWLRGGTLRLRGVGATVEISDCTFLGGSVWTQDGDMEQFGDVALDIGPRMSVTARSSLFGQVTLDQDTEFRAQDSVIRAPRLEMDALRANQNGDVVSLERCTVFGRIDVSAVGGGQDEALRGIVVPRDDTGPAGIADSIVMARGGELGQPVRIGTLQSGSVRHSFLPSGSQVPRAYACAYGVEGTDDWPRMTSTQATHAGFMQLDHNAAVALKTGGANGSEMGVGNRQMNAARMRNLDRARTDFLRFGAAAGPVFET